MAIKDKAKCHFQVFYEAKKGHFTMVRNGKKLVHDIQSEERPKTRNATLL